MVYGNGMQGACGGTRKMDGSGMGQGNINTSKEPMDSQKRKDAISRRMVRR